MTHAPESDGWEALRRRLEAPPGPSWRGRWVPRRAERATEPPDPEVTPETPRSSTFSMTLAHVVVVAVVVVVALVGTAVVVMAAQPESQTVPLDPPAASSEPPALPPALPPEPTPEPNVPSDVVVHVAGAVAEPGVIRLPAGSRVIDAVTEAGGATSGADLSTVNLARVLVDGEQVRVGLPADPAVQQPAAAAGGDPPDPVIDLNAATAADLESLPGVGPVLAGRIVEFREENGPFRSVDQLIDVPGIGPAVLDELSERVRI